MRLAYVMLGGALLSVSLPGGVDVQDVGKLTGSIEDGVRWTSFVAPESGSSSVFFYASAEAKRAPLTDFAMRRLDENGFADLREQAVLPAPDETRVAVSEKTGRLRPSNLEARLTAAGFSAGQIVEGSARSARVTGGQERIRTAFAKISPDTREAMTVAANYRLLGAPDAAHNKKMNASEALVAAVARPTISGTTAMGYASTESGNPSSLFGNILRDEGRNFVPPIGDDDHEWAARVLPASSFSSSEQKCLANGIYFEARGENAMGQAAVAQVILNRVRNPAFPNSICGVVYQNKNWRNRCQFSFACDGQRERVTERRSYAEAERIAQQVTRGEIWLNAVGSATHYHATYVRPRWASAMEKVDKIGKHVFYRTFNGGW